MGALYRKWKQTTRVNRLCLVIVILTLVAGGSMFIPGIVGWIIGIPAFCCFDFYVYLGIPIIVLAFLATAIAGLRSAAKRKGWFVRSVKAAILAHGAVLTLAVAIGILGGGLAATHEIGFWLKMNYIADVGAIRQWEQNYQVAPDDKPYRETGVFIPYSKWPPCVRKLDPGMVVYLPRTKTVDLVYGGGFGHWGLTVAPKASSHTSGISLSSGAWVWMEWQ
jgi:hypothetical protein